ncbi:juvenile hormone acid O-methyltransferase-like [Ixodes scapularis]|uniref:juvenile hormone acid O-methyltransferase-like n=1 Tax=Ixodes scapularis TaxID=6945 RepID=UPI001C3865A2|nr:juvenile hormone acid O-methyltransferase-like [Ixodes scapularis]
MHVNNEDFLSTLKPELYVAYDRKQWSANVVTLESFQKSFGRNEGGEQRYLDLGCGAGDFTREGLLPRCLPCRRIVAVDVSRDMVEYARSHFAHPKITYDVLDVVTDDVSDFVKRHGQFDSVFSFFCLNWVRNQEKALKNIALLMKPGGSCLLLFCASTPLMRCHQELARMKRWEKYAHICTNLIPPSHGLEGSGVLESYMKDLLKMANLTPSTCRVLHETFEYSNLESLVRAHVAMSPLTTLVTDRERPLFLEDVKEQARDLWAIKEAGGSPFQLDVFVVFASSKTM